MSEREDDKPQEGHPNGAQPTPEAPDETKADAPAEAEADSEEAAKAKAEAEAKAKAAAAKAKALAEAEAAREPWERDPVAPEWQEAEGEALAEALKSSFGEGVTAARTFAGELVFDIDLRAIQEVGRSLKEEHGFALLVDICGAHYPDREEAPFEVVYHLYNLEQARRIRLKVGTQEGVEVPTVVDVWKGANWPEREIYDMYGVRFAGHPDMTRILMWEGFNGHPLRKDFPVEGIDTGAAIYPEFYGEEAGPVAGTGTGWKPPKPSEEEPAPEEA
ncbi:MAG: NADH-quinone oxidoreductase subunit C [Thermoanaerobaculia bacterium]